MYVELAKWLTKLKETKQEHGDAVDLSPTKAATILFNRKSFEVAENATKEANTPFIAGLDSSIREHVDDEEFRSSLQGRRDVFAVVLGAWRMQGWQEAAGAVDNRPGLGSANNRVVLTKLDSKNATARWIPERLKRTKLSMSRAERRRSGSLAMMNQVMVDMSDAHVAPVSSIASSEPALAGYVRL
ncbi:hypothetical protein EJ03DRAFT_208750 [Teratosphaeria nubilosa]|uniref:Uncharacterized protein n=1 Tax=Teratosphaeria nubilosa TaxID=161662 RepID=A0A6G1KXS1_9PEZI|nr:hypothetical protein EJ03DRAFT_208750 [Teratosphaeria nubilosa]